MLDFRQKRETRIETTDRGVESTDRGSLREASVEFFRMKPRALDGALFFKTG